VLRWATHALPLHTVLAENVNTQRGGGVFERSIRALQASGLHMAGALLGWLGGWMDRPMLPCCAAWQTCCHLRRQQPHVSALPAAAAAVFATPNFAHPTALQMLNAAGYGQPGSGLHLDLVYNPGGAFLAPPQSKLEPAYKQVGGCRLQLSLGQDGVTEACGCLHCCVCRTAGLSSLVCCCCLQLCRPQSDMSIHL